VVENRVMRRFDHTNLNLDPLFVNRVPTTENLCKAIFELLHGALSPPRWNRYAWKRRRTTSLSTPALRFQSEELQAAHLRWAKEEENGAADRSEQIRSRGFKAERSLSEFTTQEMYREILSRLGEDPGRDGLLCYAGPRREVDGLPDQGL
jgi:6-pyruvoyl-tetrahydropterin synthase